MKKSDLKSGMVVSLRDWKEKMILIDDVFCSYERKDFLKIGNYDEKLNFKSNDRLDIVEVYKCKYPNLDFSVCFLLCKNSWLNSSGNSVSHPFLKS